MALLTTRKMHESILSLRENEEGLLSINHILEPEFHQDIYVNACDQVKELKDSFQLDFNNSILVRPPSRGLQPQYADSENDLDSLEWEGMLDAKGSYIAPTGNNQNVCALKSNCVRRGFVDFGLARSVTRSFYEAKKASAGVIRNDVLINSTGDGTIGRVAVFNEDFPALVDGHITILRFNDPDLAWYVAAFLLSDIGQKQIYRYINGSSGQVEIYPIDIERLWIKPATNEAIKKVSQAFRSACEKHHEFVQSMSHALSQV